MARSHGRSTASRRRREGSGVVQIELLEQRMEELELRVDGIEQILPTLVTKDDLRTAVSDAVGASEERMRAHVSEAVGASEERMRAHVADAVGATRTDLRTHFDVVAEGLRHELRLVAEAVAELSDRVGRS